MLSGLKALLDGRRVAVLHARPAMAAQIRAGDFGFFNRLIQVLRHQGHHVVITGLYRPPWLGWLSRRAVHLYRGPNRIWRRRRVFSIGKGYIQGYWYIDPAGYRDKSSIGERQFVRDDIPRDPAGILQRRLRRGLLNTGTSTRPQASRGAAVPEGAIAIMLQLRTLFEYRRGQVCSDAEMVRRVVAARGGRPVVIKLHPFGAKPAVHRAVKDVLDPTGRVTVTEANVHDVLDAASLVVTQTSGAGFEALLHNKNVLLFARTDYITAATKLDRLADLPSAIETAIAAKVPHARFVYWFLEQNLFRHDAPDFAKRLAAVLDADRTT